MKLSIITINLNNAKELQKTLNSIKIRTFTDYEHIIIDGGSTDASLEIIHEYKQHTNATFQWLSEKDNGIYHAMNKGIKKATGDYCFFLNSGDALVNDSVLETLFATSPTEDILFGNLLITSKDKVIGRTTGKEKLTFLDVYSTILKHQASFIRKELFLKYGYYNEERKISADWEFFMKTVGMGGASYRYFDVSISYFDNDGISSKAVSQAGIEREAIIREIVPTMMHDDYVFLASIKRYKPLFYNNYSLFLLKLIRKLFFNK